VAARAWGEDSPFKPESLGGDDEDGEEGEVTPPPHSPPPEDLPSLGVIFSWQAGVSVGAGRPKQPQMENVSSIGPPP
jgi:hypothetical protein